MIDSLKSDETYLAQLAAQSVAFHTQLAGLLRTEVVAASERDAVAKNV